MTYKGMLLSALLVPVSTMYCVQDIDLRLRNLNHVHIKKLQELSDISVRITETQVLIESLALQAQPLIESLTTDGEAYLDECLEKIEKAVCETNSISGLFLKDFSVIDNEAYKLNFIKVLIVRICVERASMAALVASYEKKLQELIELLG